MGVGVFALPPAMRMCGWALGTLMVLLLAAVSMHAADAMIEVVCELRKRGVGADNGGRIEFQEVTRRAFPNVNGTITLLCVAVWQRDELLLRHRRRRRSPRGCGRCTCAGMAAVVGPVALLRSTSHPAFQAMVAGNVSVLAAIATVLLAIGAQGAAPADELRAATCRAPASPA